MKTRILSISGGAMAVAVIGMLLVAGRMQGRQTDPAARDQTAPDTATSGDLALNDATPPATTETPVAAPAALPPAPPAISAAQPAPPGVKLSKGATEIAQLAQSGIGEEVMLAYIANVNSEFNLGSDQIVYLNDLGISGNVVKAMIQRDAAIEAAARAAAASLAAQNAPPPANPNPPAPADDASYPPAPPVDNSPALLPPYDPGAYTPTDDSEYFYSSLAPYGSWVYVAGCGRCWQPTVCLGNHEWRPYGDRGRWLYSDCGWYWQSDYSWGWAAFHYGRWYNDTRCGWVWSPDRVWGPAWVSWRQSGEYCGWAPLPPSARFVPGSGFRYANHPVAEGFEFGLRAHNYTYIPKERLSDYAPARYAAASWQVGEIHSQTKVITQVTEQNHRVINRGVDPKEVAALSRTEIRRAEIRETPRDARQSAPSDRLAKSGGGFVIYRPELPVPTRHPLGGAPGSQPSTPPAGRNFGAPRTSANPPAPAAIQPAAIAGAAPAAPTLHPAASAPYPSGSLILRGNAHADNSPAPAPLPNMKISGVSHPPSAPSQPPQLSYQQINQATYYATAEPKPGWQQPEPARSYSGYTVVNGFARPNNPEHAAPQNVPQQSQSTYVIPGHFTAAQHLNGSSSSYSVASTPAPHLSAHAEQAMEAASRAIPARYTATQQLSGSTPQNSFPQHSHSEPPFDAASHSHSESHQSFEGASHTHYESHAAAPSTPAPSSSSTSTSSGHR